MDTRLNPFKKLVHKTRKFLGHKIADGVTNSNNDNNKKQKTIKEIIIPPEKREEILNKLRKVL